MFVGGSSSLSSAEASSYRTEGWREGKRNRAGGRAGDNGRGRNLVPVFLGNPAPSWMHYMAGASTFSLFLSSLARFLFFDYCYFYWDTQREPLRRREDLRQMPSSSSLRACYPPGGVARSHAKPTCECEARHPSSRLARRNWRACSLAKFKRRSLHATKLNAKSRKVVPMWSWTFYPAQELDSFLKRGYKHNYDAFWSVFFPFRFNHFRLASSSMLSIVFFVIYSWGQRE